DALLLRGLDGEEVEQTRLAARGAEARLEHVRVGQVAAPGDEGRARRDREGAAALAIEERAEDRRRIEARQTEPVDGAGVRDQRRGPAIAEDRVSIDGGHAFDGEVSNGHAARAAPRSAYRPTLSRSRVATRGVAFR